jgi:hypothetical protein
MDWLGLESTIRDILRLVSQGRIEDRTAFILIDDAMAAYTRRGNEL